MRRITILLLSISLAASTAFAGGYQVGLHSMRNIGMGLIGTSLSCDASSLFYNPGGAAFVNNKFSISAGVSLLMARATFQAKDVDYQNHMEHKLNTPFYFYLGYKPIENLSIGLAVNTPYGLNMAWQNKETWQGRYLIQDISFQAITFQPTISYKFDSLVGIGAGLIISYGNVNLNKALPVEGVNGDGHLNIKGHTLGYGLNFGVMVHPVKGLSIGVDVRSKIKMAVKDADANFTVAPSLAGNFPNNKADVTLPLPANYDLGISYKFCKTWMVGINLNYVMWSTYDSLVFTFKTVTPAIGRTATPKLYQDRLIARIGVQWMAAKWITARIGAYYDPSPIPSDYLDPMLPSSNEIGLTCGFSIFPVKGLSIDAAFLYLMGTKRSGTYTPDNFAGTYYNVLYIPGIGLTYNF